MPGTAGAPSATGPLQPPRQHRSHPAPLPSPPAQRILVLGAGNLLLGDEGFGIHFIRHLQDHYQLPSHVELFDAGTLGLMAGHKLEEADRVYIVDVISAPGEPGACIRYRKDDFMLKRIPLKLSPHQVGVQEMLLVSALRGRCPEEVVLLGVIPACVEPGTALSPLLRKRLPEIARQLAAEISAVPAPRRCYLPAGANGTTAGKPATARQRRRPPSLPPG